MRALTGKTGLARYTEASCVERPSQHASSYYATRHKCPLAQAHHAGHTPRSSHTLSALAPAAIKVGCSAPLALSRRGRYLSRGDSRCQRSGGASTQQPVLGLCQTGDGMEPSLEEADPSNKGGVPATQRRVVAFQLAHESLKGFNIGRPGVRNDDGAAGRGRGASCRRPRGRSCVTGAPAAIRGRSAAAGGLGRSALCRARHACPSLRPGGRAAAEDGPHGDGSGWRPEA